MAGELRHRGPDGTGLYLDGRFGMANTRLAIIDVAGGDQPLPNEDGRYWVMQNGEIYNYVELRRELEDRGHRFETTCDTEVLVHAYEEWGVECVQRLNGEFAFAVWDRDEHQLFLARDRFGIRPLFVAEFGGDFIFASECKALLRHPDAGRSLDPLGLVETLTIWSTLPDRSAFTGIRELPPGHVIRLGPDGMPRQARWWDIDFREPERPARRVDDYADELLALLTDAVRIRLRADVPVAAYLSGGLDSSAVATIARDLYPQTLNSFGIGFSDERFDESEFQDLITDAIGTSLTRITVHERDIADLLPRVCELSERPTLRTAPAPLLALSKAVNDAGLKVVLTGEGADELFAGYDIFREDKIRRFWARDPDARHRGLLLTRVNAFLARDLERIGGFLTAFYGRGLGDTDDPLYSHRIRYANTARCLRLVRPDLLEQAAAEGDPLERLLRRLPRRFTGFSPLGKAQYLEINTFLSGYLLHTQGDRMLMGNSVEGRFPFLDYRIAEFAANLPDSARLLGLVEKHVLRKAVGPLLPDRITARRKQPYRAPIVRAFVGPAAPPWVRDLLEPDTLAEAGVFEPGAVARLLQKCEGARDAVSETDEMALVAVLSTMLLHDRFVAHPTLAPAVSPTRVVVGSQVETPAAAGAGLEVAR